MLEAVESTPGVEEGVVLAELSGLAALLVEGVVVVVAAGRDCGGMASTSRARTSSA